MMRFIQLDQDRLVLISVYSSQILFFFFPTIPIRQFDRRFMLWSRPKTVAADRPG